MRNNCLCALDNVELHAEVDVVTKGLGVVFDIIFSLSPSLSF